MNAVMREIIVHYRLSQSVQSNFTVELRIAAEKPGMSMISTTREEGRTQSNKANENCNDNDVNRTIFDNLT